MMTETHISTKLVLTLEAADGKGNKTTKRVTISNLREDVTADEIMEAVTALEKLLAYPVGVVKKHTEHTIGEKAVDAQAERNVLRGRRRAASISDDAGHCVRTVYAMPAAESPVSARVLRHTGRSSPCPKTRPMDKKRGFT